MGYILVFIDGTICDDRHRFSLYGTVEFLSDNEIMKDVPVENSVVCLCELADRYKITYIGARSQKTSIITQKWLNYVGFPKGELFLAETQNERLQITHELKKNRNFITGIGDRWDDNELHV